MQSPVPTDITVYYNTVYDFWGLYMSDAVQIFGGIVERKRLCQVFTAISRQPDVLDGCPVQGYDEDGVYWSKIPKWGRLFGMDGLELPFAEHFLHSEREQYFARIPGYFNGTVFAATLLQEGVCPGAFSFQAACALNIGLEHDYDDRSARHDHMGLDKDNWPVLIPAAGMWLLIAGRSIYDHCMSGDTSHGWGRGKWNRESWVLWKEQLGTFAERIDFSEECRDFAGETLRRMVEIETEDTKID